MQVKLGIITSGLFQFDLSYTTYYFLLKTKVLYVCECEYRHCKFEPLFPYDFVCVLWVYILIVYFYIITDTRIHIHKLLHGFLHKANIIIFTCEAGGHNYKSEFTIGERKHASFQGLKLCLPTELNNMLQNQIEQRLDRKPTTNPT